MKSKEQLENEFWQMINFGRVLRDLKPGQVTQLVRRRAQAVIRPLLVKRKKEVESGES